MVKENKPEIKSEKPRKILFVKTYQAVSNKKSLSHTVQSLNPAKDKDLKLEFYKDVGIYMELNGFKSVIPWTNIIQIVVE